MIENRINSAYSVDLEDTRKNRIQFNNRANYNNNNIISDDRYASKKKNLKPILHDYRDLL